MRHGNGGLFSARKGGGSVANMSDEFIQTHVEVAEEALDATIDNTIDALNWR